MNTRRAEGSRFPLRGVAVSFLKKLPRDVLESVARGDEAASSACAALFALELGPDFERALLELHRLEGSSSPNAPT